MERQYAPLPNERVFFTSDLHFNHRRIIEYTQRPFGSVEEMNEALIERFNETVGPTDTVYILGDLVLGKDLRCAERLNGRKILLMGNHDRVQPEAYEAIGIEVVRGRGVKAKEFWYDGYRIVHSPVPVIREAYLTMNDMPAGYRDAQRRGILDGIASRCVCGHVHRVFRKVGKFVNVSVDVWDYRPASWEAVREAFLEPDSLFT